MHCTARKRSKDVREACLLCSKLASAAQSAHSQYLETTGRGRGGNVTLTCFDDLMLDSVSIPIGEREWRVECVRDQGRVLAYAESHAQAPYGLLLWESAVALARSLHRRPKLVANKKVLEMALYYLRIRGQQSVDLLARLEHEGAPGNSPR